MPMCLGPCRIVNLSLPSSPTLLPSGEGRLGISPLPLGEGRFEIPPLPPGETRLEIPPLPWGEGLGVREQRLRYPSRPSHCRQGWSSGRDHCVLVRQMPKRFCGPWCETAVWADINSGASTQSSWGRDDTFLTFIVTRRACLSSWTVDNMLNSKRMTPHVQVRSPRKVFVRYGSGTTMFCNIQTKCLSPFGMR